MAPLKPASLSIPWVTFSTGFVVGLAVLFVDQAEHHRFESQTRQSVLQQLNTVRSLLEGQLQTHLLLAQNLAQQALKDSSGPLPEGLVLSEPLQQHYPAIQEVVWHPASLRANAKPVIPLRPAFEADSLGVIRLQVPLAPSVDEADSSMLGWVSLKLDLERLVEGSQVGERVSDLNWSVRTLDRDSRSAQLLLGDAVVFEDGPVTADVRFAQEVWQIAGIPNQGWAVRSPLQPWIRTLGTSVIFGAMLMVFSVLRSDHRQSRVTEAILAQLNEQKQQYRGMADRTPVILLQLDHEGIPRFANLYAQSFLGYDVPSLEEMALWERLASPELKTLVEDAQGNQTVALSRIVPIHRCNGEPVWINWHICLLADPLPGSGGLLCIGYDVSDRQGIQTRLLKAESQLRELFTLMGHRLVLVDAQGRYAVDDRQPDPRLEPSLAVHKSTVGDSPALTGTCLRESFAEADAAHILERVEAAIANPPQESHLCLKLEIPRNEGTEAESGPWLSLSVFPFRDGYALLFLDDITEQRHLKRYLERTQQELEQRVRDRTAQIYESNKCLQAEVVERMQIEEALRLSEEREREKAQQLEHTLKQLKRTQAQLVQTEKMSSLGQLAAGMAHEINNPVNFISGNLTPVRDYIGDLLELVTRYQQEYPQPSEAIAAWYEEIELPFLQEDVLKILQSMHVGTERIQKIIASLKNFARLDEMGQKSVDIHEGIDSTLMVLQNRLRGQGKRADISVVKKYGMVPKVTCYASQINQVLMNVLDNAIDAIEERLARQPDPLPEIRISTHHLDEDSISIILEDNGTGIPGAVQGQVFNPFFTTKVVGKGTGLGLSIAYQVIHETHGGRINITSQPGQTQFEIQLPYNPTHSHLK